MPIRNRKTPPDTTALEQWIGSQDGQDARAWIQWMMGRDPTTAEWVALYRAFTEGTVPEEPAMVAVRQVVELMTAPAERQAEVVYDMWLARLARMGAADAASLQVLSRDDVKQSFINQWARQSVLGQQQSLPTFLTTDIEPAVETVVRGIVQPPQDPLEAFEQSFNRELLARGYLSPDTPYTYIEYLQEKLEQGRQRLSIAMAQAQTQGAAPPDPDQFARQFLQTSVQSPFIRQQATGSLPPVLTAEVLEEQLRVMGASPEAPRPQVVSETGQFGEEHVTVVPPAQESETVRAIRRAIEILRGTQPFPSVTPPASETDVFGGEHVSLPDLQPKTQAVGGGMPAMFGGFGPQRIGPQRTGADFIDLAERELERLRAMQGLRRGTTIFVQRGGP